MPCYTATNPESFLEILQSKGHEHEAERVNLAQKLSLFTDHYSPKIVGEVNDTYVKLVKLQGDFMWHHHDNEDELFFVVKGTLRMKVRRTMASASSL